MNEPFHYKKREDINNDLAVGAILAGGCALFAIALIVAAVWW